MISDSVIDAAAAMLVRTASRSSAFAEPCSAIHRGVGVRSNVGADVLGWSDGESLEGACEGDVGLSVFGPSDGEGLCGAGDVDGVGVAGFADGAGVDRLGAWVGA